MLLLLACTSAPPEPAPTPEAAPPATAPVATTPPAEPSAETRAAAEALVADARAVDASFAAAYAGRETLAPGDVPCALTAAGPLLWAGTPAPRGPGVAEANEVLSAVDPVAWPRVAPAAGATAPVAAASPPTASPPTATPPSPGAAPEHPSPGTGPEDFKRVQERLAANVVLYAEREAAPPDHTTGRAFLWDGTTRRFTCAADVDVKFGAEPGAMEAAILEAVHSGARVAVPAPVPPAAAPPAAPKAAPPAAPAPKR